MNFALALAGIFLTCYILTSLGYFIGLTKSKRTPQKQVLYLGFVIDSELQAFTLLPLKKEKFLRLVKEILPRDTLDLLTLQRLGGKCMSLSLAFQVQGFMLLKLTYLCLAPLALRDL